MNVVLAAEAVDWRDELVALLHSLGHNVAVADSGSEMDAALMAEDPDVLILHPLLPGLNCFAFLEDRAAATMSLPVLLLGQGEVDSFITDCMLFTAIDFVLLPTNAYELQARLVRLAGQEGPSSEPGLDTRGALELSEFLRRNVMPFGLRYSGQSDTTRDELFASILEECQRISNADAASLYRVEGEKLTMNCAHITSMQTQWGGTGGIPLHHDHTLPLESGLDPSTHPPELTTFAQFAALQGELHVLSPTDMSPSMGVFTSLLDVDYGICAALFMPLKNSENEVIAVIELLNPVNPRTGQCVPFRKSVVLALESFATQASVALSTQALLEQQRMFVKFETDLRVGREVQASFLPESLPDIPGWQMARRFFPARQVSGDFFDVFEIRRDIMALVIADVCDKGVPAALYMALSRSMLRAFAQQNYSLSWAKSLWSDTTTSSSTKNVTFELDSAPLREGLKRANDYLVVNHGDLTMFATTFFALLNTRTGQLLYVNCGHNPPMIVNNEGNVRASLLPTGPVMGVVKNMRFTIGQEKVMPGETLVMYTDGVPEGRDITGAFYGAEHFQELIESRQIESAEEIMQRIEQDLFEFVGDAVQFDDVTMMAVYREPGEEPTA